MTTFCTLHEISVKCAQKQPGMADDLTENAPILGVCKWKPASHKSWNVAEKLVDIEGAAFVEHDAPLPMMKTSSDLVTTYLHTLGGIMQIPTQRAKALGGYDKYFAEKQPAILRHAGMTTEKALVLNNWLEAAIKSGNAVDAGGTSDGWFLLAVRFDDLTNTGLYDPDQFVNGTLLQIDALYGGQEHRLHAEGYEGVLGYEVVYRGKFGWQILEASRTCAAIVNIDESVATANNGRGAITPADIDNLLADVRAQAGSTYLFCSPRAKILTLNKYKHDNLQMTNGDAEAKIVIDRWNGIPVITSYNIMDKIPNIKAARKVIGNGN